MHWKRRADFLKLDMIFNFQAFQQTWKLISLREDEEVCLCGRGLAHKASK